MIAAIIVLAVLLGIAGTAILILSRAIINLISYDSFDLKKWFDDNIVEEYNCTVIACYIDNFPYESSIYDFSKYEKYGIVGIILYTSGEMPHAGEPTIFLNQKVCLMKDGGYEWDVRPLL